MQRNKTSVITRIHPNPIPSIQALLIQLTPCARRHETAAVVNQKKKRGRKLGPGGGFGGGVQKERCTVKRYAATFLVTPWIESGLWALHTDM